MSGAAEGEGDAQGGAEGLAAGEVVVDVLDGDGALADRGGDPVHRAVADTGYEVDSWPRSSRWPWSC